MGAWIFTLFVVLPAIDLYLLIAYGGALGLLGNLGLLFLGFVFGMSLIRHTGLRLVTRITQSLSYGRVPTDAMLDGLLLFVAGLLFIIPGYLTDVLAFLLMLPPLRFLLRLRLRHRVALRFGGGVDGRYSAGSQATYHDDDTINDPFGGHWSQTPGARKPDIEITPETADPERSRLSDSSTPPRT